MEEQEQPEKEKRMPTYQVPVTVWADAVVTIETDETDPDKIAEMVETNVPVTLCSGCSDHRNGSLSIGDEWQAVRNESGIPQITRLDGEDN